MGKALPLPEGTDDSLLREGKKKKRPLSPRRVEKVLSPLWVKRVLPQTRKKRKKKEKKGSRGLAQEICSQAAGVFGLGGADPALPKVKKPLIANADLQRAGKNRCWPSEGKKRRKNGFVADALKRLKSARTGAAPKKNSIKLVREGKKKRDAGCWCRKKKLKESRSIHCRIGGTKETWSRSLLAGEERERGVCPGGTALLRRKEKSSGRKGE